MRDTKNKNSVEYKTDKIRKMTEVGPTVVFLRPHPPANLLDNKMCVYRQNISLYTCESRHAMTDTSKTANNNNALLRVKIKLH